MMAVARQRATRVRQLAHLEQRVLRDLDRMAAPDEVSLMVREALATWRQREDGLTMSQFAREIGSVLRGKGGRNGD